MDCVSLKYSDKDPEKDNVKESQEEWEAALPPPSPNVMPVCVVGVLDRWNDLFMAGLIAFMALFLPVNSAGCLICTHAARRSRCLLFRA